MRKKDVKIVLFTLIYIAIIILLTIISLYAYPQETFLEGALFSIILAVLFAVILLLTTQTKLTIKYIEIAKEKKWLSVVAALTIVFLPLISWFLGGVKIENILIFLGFFLLPISVMLIPLMGKLTNFRVVFHIPAVIIMAIGFDNRYAYKVIPAFDDGKYELTSVWVAALVLTILSTQIEDFKEKFNWKISKQKMLIVLISFALLMLLIIPPGLITGFLVWNPTWPGTIIFIGSFIGIWMTIALIEESVARGILLHEPSLLAKKLREPKQRYVKIAILVVSSFIFGLSHWNNTSPEFIWWYILFATIAGIFYGICWWKGGLFSAMLIHTLVDWVWQLMLSS
ncbi:MAG: CPBP family intramembrane glutamic endopeptidase [Candidatus Heimdallarchaeaceae archaeon]